MHQLAQHPEVAQAAREELSHLTEDADLSAMHYLDAVINETMRLCPVVPNIARELQAPMKIGGHDLPKGVVIALCIYLTHRRAELWPEPEKFDPTRFIDARPDPYKFFPFGGGTRRCLGAAFATYQMKIVLVRSATPLRPRTIARLCGASDARKHRNWPIRRDARGPDASHRIDLVHFLI